jgi:hypothetical protein
VLCPWEALAYGFGPVDSALGRFKFFVAVVVEETGGNVDGFGAQLEILVVVVVAVTEEIGAVKGLGAAQ